MDLAPNQIGGGRVRRTFKMGEARLKSGHILTGDEVRKIPSSNRRSLIESGALEIWPHVPAMVEGAARYVVPMGNGKYGVIVGHMLNAEPLSKKDAEELASVSH